MARMIPATISPDVKSSAERKIFKWLQNLEWQNCIVLHSLEMAEHVDNIFGEIDFVIIADDGVLCIEVKGGVVARTEGVWSFTNRWGRVTQKKKGPYNQVQGNEQSLREYLTKRLGQRDPISRCQFACCVMAPDCQITIDKDPNMKIKDRIDFIPEITFDMGMTKDDLPVFFENCFKYWKDDMIKHGNRPGGGLSQHDKNRLVELLRGDFALVPSMDVILHRTEEILLSLTDEQYMIMQIFYINKRMLIYGPAGTGKTLLAMEQCRRMKAEGKRGAYLCYNKMIAETVKTVFENEGNNIDVYTLPGILMKLTKEAYPERGQFSDNYFKEVLPALFITGAETFLSEEMKYDVLVVDEGQDLMIPLYIQCIDKMIKGGIEKGQWSIYYDKNQNIFGQYEEMDAICQKLEDIAACYPLSVNCRNTKQIATANWYMTSIDQARIMKAEGEQVEYHKYKTLEDERRQLFQQIRRLHTEGISNADIIILSPYLSSNSKSCLYDCEFPQDIGELHFNESRNIKNKNVINAYTIQAFKGLEAKIILYIDVQGFILNENRLLNYVAISRAKAYLEMFYKEEMEPDRQKMLLKTLKENS